jgi:hypothetical protein
VNVKRQWRLDDRFAKSDPHERRSIAIGDLDMPVQIDRTLPCFFGQYALNTSNRESGDLRATSVSVRTPAPPQPANAVSRARMQAGDGSWSSANNETKT